MSEKNKKIIGIIAGVIAFAAIFAAGYFLSGSIFTDKSTPTDAVNNTDTTASQTVTDPIILENEKLGSGDLTIGQSEYLYYCASVFDSICSAAFQYDYYYGEGMGLTFTGYDYTKSPSEQPYAGDEVIEGVENPTYLDYIEHVAKKQLHTVKAYVDFAKINNITLTEADYAEIDVAFSNAEQSIVQSGMTLEEYLKKYFGESMTSDVLRSVMEEQYIVNKVDKIKSDTYRVEYTDEKVEELFNENLLKYAVVTLRDYAFAAETETKEDGKTAVKEGAMEKAKLLAEKFAQEITDETSFKELAAAAEKEKGSTTYNDYLENDSYTLLKDVDSSTLEQQTGDTEFIKWAFDPETVSGDIRVREVADYGYVVYMISEPAHKAATVYTYDVRHTLFKFAEDGSITEGNIKPLDTSEYDSVIDIEVATETTKDPGLYMQAQDALVEYLEGDRTEESFGELAKKYSADSNAASGGIYQNVEEGKMVAEFENWALKEGRQAGDVGIVETQYGYHVMYFIKKNIGSSWQSEIIDGCIYDQITAFTESLNSSYKSEVDGYNEGYDESVKAAIEKLVSSNLEYYNEIIAGLEAATTTTE